jgi:hypothetical protein
LSGPVYEHDPEQAPDQEFLPGDLGHLVVGNRGRLLDSRRTPIAVTAVVPETGSFEVRIEAFEDAGARWAMPLEDVGRFQFARDGALTSRADRRVLQTAQKRFDRELVIEVDEHARRRCIEWISGERRKLRAEIEESAVAPDLAAMIDARQGDPSLFAMTERVLAARGLAQLDNQFADAFVSNPHAGEIVKGHAIVLAELGLCPYHGKVVRDPELFEGAFSKEMRGRHLVTRLALSRALWSTWGHQSVTLFRGAAINRDVTSMAPRASFVSATFSLDVAREQFLGGQDTRTAVLWRRRVLIDRLLMTFVETRALNGRFKEAEAVLLAEPGSESL